MNDLIDHSSAGKSTVPPVVSAHLAGQEGQGLKDYWLVVRRHRRLIFKLWIATVIATALVCLIMPRTYKAVATVLIQREPARVITVQDQGQLYAPNVPDTDHDFYKTQNAILSSPELEARVIDRLNLGANGIFTGTALHGPIPGIEHAIQRMAGLLTRFAGAPDGHLGNRLGVPPSLIGNYDAHLKVSHELETQLVDIEIKSSDPSLSAAIANAHAQEFISESRHLRNEPSAVAERFLEGELDDIRARLEHSEMVLNDYRRERGIVENMEQLDGKTDGQDPANVAIERMAALNNHLADATSDRIRLEAEVYLIKNSHYETIPEVVNNLTVEALQQQLAARESELSSLQNQFSDHYPKTAALVAEAAQLRGQLNAVVRDVVGSIQNSYTAVLKRDSELASELNVQKTAVLALHDDNVKYAVLARDVATNQALYQGVVERMKQFGMDAESDTSNVQVVVPAVSPIKPSCPRTFLSLGLSAVGGLVLGLCCAFFRENFDDRLANPAELESYLHLPHLASVPDFSLLQMKSAGPPPVVPQTNGVMLYTQDRSSLSERSFSIITEAYRGLHTAVLLSRASKAPRTILFTSAMTGEGKSTTVLNTAIAFAAAGAKVLIADADLRRPQADKLPIFNNGVGLTEVLAGQADLNECVKPVGACRFTYSVLAPSLPALRRSWRRPP